MTEYFSDQAEFFTVGTQVRDDYRPTTCSPFYPVTWAEVPIKDPTDDRATIGFAEYLPHDCNRPDWHARRDMSRALCSVRFAEPPELHDYEPGTAREVGYAVIRERTDDGTTTILGLVEYTPPGVTRPRRPAPYAGVPILASLTW